MKLQETMSILRILLNVDRQKTNPNSDEINSCSRFLDRQISLISPNIIILLGKVAAERLMNSSETNVLFKGQSTLLQKY